MDLNYGLNLFFMLSWMVGWGYLVYLYLKYPGKFLFWKRGGVRENWVNLVAVLGMMLAPYVWVNFHQNPDYYDYQRNLDKFSEKGDAADLMRFHEFAIVEYPNNARVNVEYMLYATNWGLKSWLIDLAEFYEDQVKSGNEPEKFQLLSELGYRFSGLSFFSHASTDLDSAKNLGLYHYTMAELSLEEGDMAQAQHYFIEAMQDEEFSDLAYDRLEHLWFKSLSLEEVSEFAYHPDVYPFMPFGLKRDIYIKDKAWGWYLYNGIYRDFLSADLPAYIGVSFALFVWLLFITQILFIQREKWKYIIMLFALGALFPVMVYVLHDLLEAAYASLGLEIDNHTLLDCIVNIGMVEELVKVIPWLIIYLAFRREFHRPVHFMLLPIISALGFAFSENLIYVNSRDYELVFARSAISLVMHISCSATIGYLTWRAQLQKERLRKYGFVLGGFLLASTIHGLFDYVLYARSAFMDVIIMLLAMHLLILFINNAINFSGIKDKNAIRRLHQSGIILMVGLLAIFSAQYVIVGWHYAPVSANFMFKRNFLIVLLITGYLVATFTRVRLRPRVLYKFSFADVFGQFIKTSNGNYMDEVDYQHWEFRLFAPKDNVFVGKQFPVRAKAIKRVVVQKDLKWWLVQFEHPIYVQGADSKFALVRSKERDEDLFMDKTEVMLMMIPNYAQFEARSKHHSSQFIYTGRVYSRPVVTGL